MKKLTIIIGVAVFVFALAILAIALMIAPNFSGNVVKSSQPIVLTEENFPAYLQDTLTPDLPKNSKISISVGDKNYVLTGKSILSEEISDPEISVIIPDSYLGKEYAGVCDLLREMARNGDISVDTSLSKAELLWEYRRFLKYRPCFGN